MYGEDYLDNLFSAVYYTPVGENHLLRPGSSGPSAAGKKVARHRGKHVHESTSREKEVGGGKTKKKSSKFVNKIRQQSHQTRKHNLHHPSRPLSAPAKQREPQVYEPLHTAKVDSYDEYIRRKQRNYAETEPVRQMESSEYPSFPVLSEAGKSAESHSRVSYEDDRAVIANESNFVNDATAASWISDKPSVVSEANKQTKASSSRPYNLNKQYTDMNEWIGLRQNYIHQIESLEKYEKMCGASQVLSEISMPNFFGLLIAIRKISIRIADAYRLIVLQKETPLNMLEVHSYVVSMATDLECLDRQPFVDWTGLHLSFNPFICGYRLDGKICTAIADLNVKSSKLNESNPTMIPEELVMDQYETAECRDLGAVVWGAYVEDQRKRKIQMEQDEAIREKMIQASVRKAELAMKREAFEFSGPQAVEQRACRRAWIAWKKAYHLEVSIRNMASVRGHYIKRKVFGEIVRYMWVSQSFRRMLERRAQQLLEMTFQGWFEYLLWCREFNRIYYQFGLHHKRYCFNRLKLLEFTDRSVRVFKRKRRMRPLFLTFRALKRHCIVEGFLRKMRLKNGTPMSFADLNLRFFMFSRWAHFTKLSIATDNFDNVLNKWAKRVLFRRWKTQIFGVGLVSQIASLVNSASTKLAAVPNNSIPAIESSNTKWTSKLSGIFGL